LAGAIIELEGIRVKYWRPPSKKKKKRGKNLSPRNRKACHSASTRVKYQERFIYVYIITYVYLILAAITYGHPSNKSHGRQYSQSLTVAPNENINYKKSRENSPIKKNGRKTKTHKPTKPKGQGGKQLHQRCPPTKQIEDISPKCHD
jgi:hypothetical protein